MTCIYTCASPKHMSKKHHARGDIVATAIASLLSILQHDKSKLRPLREMPISGIFRHILWFAISYPAEALDVYITGLHTIIGAGRTLVWTTAVLAPSTRPVETPRDKLAALHFQIGGPQSLAVGGWLYDLGFNPVVPAWTCQRVLDGFLGVVQPPHHVLVGNSITKRVPSPRHHCIEYTEAHTDWWQLWQVFTVIRDSSPSWEYTLACQFGGSRLLGRQADPQATSSINQKYVASTVWDMNFSKNMHVYMCVESM